MILSWLVCHFISRRDSDKHSQLAADLGDILQAFVTLDSSDTIPEIYCEATDLLRVPSLSLDPVSEQVQTNTQALHNLTSKIESLEKEISTFQGSGTTVRSCNDLLMPQLPQYLLQRMPWPLPLVDPSGNLYNQILVR